MKTLLLFSALFYSYCSLAGLCQSAWEKENKANKVLESCELEWKDSGIELVRLQNGCSFPGPDSEPCFILRSCGKEKEKGASVFRSTTPLENYCISGKNTEAMGASKAFGAKAQILCSGKKKPQGIQLIAPDGKLTKTCKFPFAQAR